MELEISSREMLKAAVIRNKLNLRVLVYQTHKLFPTTIS